MNALPALAVVLGLGGVAWAAGALLPLRPVFGVVVPALAFGIFIAGITLRVAGWARVPVPFRIPTTCGQQRSLPWIRSSWLECPWTTAGVVARMALEVLLFRSLFRHTAAAITTGRALDGHESAGPGSPGPVRLVFGEQKWLWLAALVFHWSFLVAVLRHLRFFLEPTPAWVGQLAAIDGFFQAGVPVVYVTDVTMLAALTYLLARRLSDAQARFISLFQDYAALYLLIGVAGTGVLMRYLVRTDVVAIKQMMLGLATFAPVVPGSVNPFFFVHLFLVSVLLACFPFSKLVHMGGAFLSPTRNLANTSRTRRHVNPWDYPVKVHTYEEWEDEFRDKLKAAGLPVEKA